MKVTSNYINNNKPKMQTSNNVAFTGNNPLINKSAPGALVEKVGNLAAKKDLSLLKSFTEFKGINMTFNTLCMYCFGFVIAPRVIKAKARDKDGTGDEVREILTRDLPTVTTIVFALPILNKVLAKGFNKASGLVLSYKPKGQETAKGFKNLMNYLKPNHGITVLSNAQAEHMYGSVDKLANGFYGFCDLISQKGGKLGKTLSYARKEIETPLEKLYKENSTNPKKSVFEATNEEIIDAVKAAKEKGSSRYSEINYKLSSKDNGMVKKAKGYLSISQALNMFIVIPGFLGFFLPLLNIHITNKKYAKQKEDNNSLKKSDINSISKNVIEQNIGKQFASFQSTTLAK